MPDLVLSDLHATVELAGPPSNPHAAFTDPPHTHTAFLRYLYTLCSTRSRTRLQAMSTDQAANNNKASEPMEIEKPSIPTKTIKGVTEADKLGELLSWKFFSFSAPHMRAFHLAWFGFFIVST